MEYFVKDGAVFAEYLFGGCIYDFPSVRAIFQQFVPVVEYSRGMHFPQDAWVLIFDGVGAVGGGRTME